MANQARYCSPFHARLPGAGKTLVAAELCKHVAENKWNKVIFFICEGIPLVFQQAGYLAAHTGLRVRPLCGAVEIHDWRVRIYTRMPLSPLSLGLSCLFAVRTTVHTYFLFVVCFDF